MEHYGQHGGCNNNVNHDFSAVFGCAVNTLAPLTFHANNFAAQNMPPGPGPIGSGIFYVFTSGGVNYVAIS